MKESLNEMVKLLYFKNNACGVCVAFLPKFQRIVEKLGVEYEIIDVVENPEKAGQMMVFTVPTIVVLDPEENEVKRFARVFSEFEILESIQRILDQLVKLWNN